MSKDYKIVYQGGVGEVTEKKSRFIATVFPVKSEEEAAGQIENIRRKYWDARHNCHAYIVGKQDISRCSDDGEPSGTAGRPILETLVNEGLHDVLVVVTRYFGGTLLGTGGLVRAYSAAAKAGIMASSIAALQCGQEIKLSMDYNYVGKIQHILAEYELVAEDITYAENVGMQLLVPQELLGDLQKKIRDVSSGQISMEDRKELKFATVQGKVIYKDYGSV